MTDGRSIRTPCPKCRGWGYKDLDGDLRCLQCGFCIKPGGPDEVDMTRSDGGPAGDSIVHLETNHATPPLESLGISQFTGYRWV